MTVKITDVKAYPLKTRTALVWVFSDASVDGVGECSPMNVPVMCHVVETLAETWDLPVMPHMTQPTVGNAASLHLCATIPLSSRPHEYTGPRPDLDQLFTDSWEFRDGSMSIPDRPGLGLSLNETALDRALLR